MNVVFVFVFVFSNNKLDQFFSPYCHFIIVIFQGVRYCVLFITYCRPYALTLYRTVQIARDFILTLKHHE